MFPLPQELVSLIVHQFTSQRDLYNCSLINKAFHQVANPLLWHTPNIDNHATARRFFASLQSIPYPALGGGRFVRHLLLIMPRWSDNEFLLVMQHMTHLETLSMILSINITNRSLQQLPHLCPRLNDLQFTMMPVGQPTVDALGQHCRQLTRLTFSDCWYLGPDTFSALMPCPLTCLTIEYPGVGPRMTANAITDLASSGFDQLTHLTLGNTNFDNNNNNNNNNEFISHLLSLAATPDIWPRLIHLTILSYDPKDGTKVYGDSAFASGLVRFLQSHDIKHLGLESGQYDDSVLDAMGAIRPPPTSLTSLSLMSSKKLTAAAVRRLIQRWPMLSSVSLGCSRKMALNKFPELRNNDNNDIHRLFDSASSYIDVVTDLDEQAIRRIRQGDSQGSSQSNNGM